MIGSVGLQKTKLLEDAVLGGVKSFLLKREQWLRSIEERLRKVNMQHSAVSVRLRGPAHGPNVENRK